MQVAGERNRQSYALYYRRTGAFAVLPLSHPRRRGNLALAPEAT